MPGRKTVRAGGVSAVARRIVGASCTRAQLPEYLVQHSAVIHPLPPTLVGSKGWTTTHQRFVRLNRAIFHLMLLPKVRHDTGC